MPKDQIELKTQLIMMICDMDIVNYTAEAETEDVTNRTDHWVQLRATGRLTLTIHGTRKVDMLAELEKRMRRLEASLDELQGKNTDDDDGYPFIRDKEE